MLSIQLKTYLFQRCSVQWCFLQASQTASVNLGNRSIMNQRARFLQYLVWNLRQLVHTHFVFYPYWTIPLLWCMVLLKYSDHLLKWGKTFTGTSSFINFEMFSVCQLNIKHFLNMLHKEHFVTGATTLLDENTSGKKRGGLGSVLPSGQWHLSFKPLQRHIQNAMGIQVIYMPVSVWLQWC